MQYSYDVAVVGAGAAGMLAAGTAAGRGLQTLLLERNDRPGKKLKITGKGRCNLTNYCDVRDFLKNVAVNGKFLTSCLYAFDPQAVTAFFHELGVPTKVERGNRVFPASDRAEDVVCALSRYVSEMGCDLRYEHARSIRHDTECFTIVCAENTYKCRSVILCTGGLSYPATGSTGDGYRFAQKLGHTIQPLVPALVPLTVTDPACTRMQGLSLKNVTLTVQDTITGKPVFSELGEMLFTHFGLSGPLVLSASSHLKKMEPGRYCAVIDLKPGLTEEQLDARLLRDFEQNANRNYKNILGRLLPQKMIPEIIALSAIPEELKVHQITKEMRRRLCSLLKGLAFPISGFRPIAEAIITSGGVSVKEVHPKTMESKLIPGLFFAGEILDVDAYTGGFNLQIAFSTGRAAGLHACAQIV